MTEPTSAAEQAPPQPKARLHLNYLDGIRGLAALYVALGHALLQAYPAFSQPGTYPELHGWKLLGALRHGHDGVSIFIILSGFCLMIPVSRAGMKLDVGWKTFIKKRFIRIIPTYYASLIISLILALTVLSYKTGTHWDVTIPVTTKDIITHFLLVQDILPSTQGKINHVFWSISVEWRIYFLFPFLIYAFRKWGMVWSTVVTFVICSIIWKLLRHDPVYNSLTIQYLALFVCGMMGCEIVFGNSDAANKWKKLPWGLMAGVFFAAYVAALAVGVPTLVKDFLTGFWGVCLIISVGLNPKSTAAKMLSWKPIAWLGMVGYSLYLMHAPIMQLMQQYVLQPLGITPTTANGRLLVFGILSTFGIAVILVIVWLFYLAFEKPFTIMTKKITAKATGTTKEIAV